MCSLTILSALFENHNHSRIKMVLPTFSRRMKWAEHVARMGERRDIYMVLVRKPEGKRLLGRPWRRWEDNIKMDILTVGCGGKDWIKLAHDRDSWQAFVNAVMNLRVP